MIEKDFADPQRHQRWQEYAETHRNLVIAQDTLYHCGGGVTGFYLDPYGMLRPCTTLQRIQASIRAGAFLDGWRDISDRIAQKKAPQNYQCNQCEDVLFCGYCPARFALENGAEDVPSEYTCMLGRYRFERIAKEKGGWYASENSTQSR